jgi:hypothetical protein
VTASAPALTREDEVRSKIGKVRVFGRFARVVCSVIFAFSLVGRAFILMISLLAAFGVIAPAATGIFTLQPRSWALPTAAIMVGVWLALVYQLYRLSGNLAAGAIYTPENVRRVRYVGLLWMSQAALHFAIPFAWSALIALGLIEPSDPPTLVAWLPWPEALNGFASGGLVLLISWVMDVGLYEKDHADALQRDADLVI